MKKQGYRYNLVKEGMRQQQWTGCFETKELALAWFAKYGKWHESRGHNLILVKTKSNE